MFAARSPRLLPALLVGLLLALGCEESSNDTTQQGEGAAGVGSGMGGSASVNAGGAGTSSSAGAGGEGGVGGETPPSPPPPTCDDNAHVGDYCGGDKVSNGDPGTLYRCNGPGPATVQEVCADGCVVAPQGIDDYCDLGLPVCEHKPLLKYGLCPDASDRFRCSGIGANDISQTIGNAPASAGTHAQDGTIDGEPYCAATDVRTINLSDAEVKVLLDDLASQGFAAFFRNPGHDGWPSSEARHIHAIYVGVAMKASLRAQVQDWIDGKNGLTSHTPYTFYQASPAKKALIQELFDLYN